MAPMKAGGKGGPGGGSKIKPGGPGGGKTSSRPVSNPTRPISNPTRPVSAPSRSGGPAKQGAKSPGMAPPDRRFERQNQQSSGFGGARPGPPPPPRDNYRASSQPTYRSSGGSGLGALLAGVLGASALSQVSQNLSGAGFDYSDATQETPPEEAVSQQAAAPAFAVECPHCGATIPAGAWECEYCSMPRPMDESDKD